MKTVSALLAVIFTGATCAAALADTQKNVGTFGPWSVWTYSTSERKGCFIYANPARMAPSTLDHGQVSFFVRSTENKGERAEASLQFGYDQSAKSEGVVKVGDKTFHLMTDHKHAWLVGATDSQLLDAMKATGGDMTVNTVSLRGNRTSYEFPLKGVTDAMQALRRYCPR